MNDFIAEVTMENAQQLLINESQSRLVVVDFWADWCEPCKNLMPVLEKLANEFQGQFLLAKVNADDQQMLASQFGVRSLPTVIFMKDGQPVDGFAGVQTEQEIRTKLESFLPKPWDLMHDQAKELISQQDLEQAAMLLRDAYQQSNLQADIALSLAAVLTKQKRFDEAEEIVGKIKLVDQDERFEHVKAELDLARQAQKAPELEALEKELAQDPENQEIAHQLAVQYSAHEFHSEALNLLFQFLCKDLNCLDGEIKKCYLEILAVLGKGDPLAAKYQRKLFTLLY